MVTVPQFNLSAFPDSPYAAEREEGPRNLRFRGKVEAEYVRDRLTDSRAMIRVVTALAVLMAVLRGLEQAIGSSWSPVLLIDYALVFAVSVVLLAIAWSPAFERLYLPWACVIVPLRNSIVAAHIAEAASRGHLEVLMGLPVVLVGSFFFFGFRFRAALFSGVLTVASFITAAICFELVLPIALRVSAFLLMAVIACAMAARHLEKGSRISFLERHLIAELAQHDALTGTKNRRVFDEYLIRIWKQAIEDGRAIAMLLVDVDHFKAYNDRYGHQAGDQTLRRVAQAVQRFVHRPLDILARYGGEEFVAILYDVDANQAREHAESMRRAVADLAIEHRGSRTHACVTISVGVAVVEPTLERKPRGALQLADQALYQAKVAGRNRVELMDDAEYRMLVTGVFAKGSARAGA